MFTAMIQGSGVVFAFPDVCKVPATVSPATMPYTLRSGEIATVICVSNKPSERNIYKVSDRSMRAAPLPELAPTYIVNTKGDVFSHQHLCLTPDSAREAVRTVLSPRHSATVLSTSKDGRIQKAYWVTPQSVKELLIKEYKAGPWRKIG